MKSDIFHTHILEKHDKLITKTLNISKICPKSDIFHENIFEKCERISMKSANASHFTTIFYQKHEYFPWKWYILKM